MLDVFPAHDYEPLRGWPNASAERTATPAPIPSGGRDSRRRYGRVFTNSARSADCWIRDSSCTYIMWPAG